MGDVATPALTLRALHAPKEGSQPDQYEDAWAVSPDGAETRTIAVADGASSAIFARDWANLLVAEFASGPFSADDDRLREQVAALGKVWRESVTARATSWYAQEKLPAGSAAALLVVTWDSAARTWEARAVGDACLFVVRANRLKFAFPVTKSVKFGDRPALLTTEKPLEGENTVARFAAPYEAGDRFLLMTDALAAWFLTEWESKRKPWNDLPATDAALAGWLQKRRNNRTLKNDDVTLVDVIMP